MDIEILDARGSIVSQVINQERWCNCLQSMEIDIRDLAEGVYFVQIKDGEEMIRKRFVGLDSTADYAFNKVNGGENIVTDRVNQSRDLSLRINSSIDHITELEN